MSKTSHPGHNDSSSGTRLLPCTGTAPKHHLSGGTQCRLERRLPSWRDGRRRHGPSGRDIADHLGEDVTVTALNWEDLLCLLAHYE